MHDLHRHPAIEPRIARAIHRSHASMADLVADLVAVDAGKHVLGSIVTRPRGCPCLYTTSGHRYTPSVFVNPYPANLSPEQIALRLGRSPGFVWLDGGMSHGQEGRFSFLGAMPTAVVERALGADNPLAALDALATPETAACADRAAPFSPGDVPGWIGHIAYDAHELDVRRGPKAPAPALP